VPYTTVVKYFCVKKLKYRADYHSARRRSYNKLDIISCFAHNSGHALVTSGGRSVGGRGSRGG